MHNPNDPKDLRRARREAKQRALSNDTALLNLMSTPTGRQWVYDFLAYCGVFQTPFSTDPGLMAFNVGKGDAGRKLLSDVVRVDAQGYLKMLEEQSNGRGSDDTGGDSGEPGSGGDSEDGYSSSD